MRLTISTLRFYTAIMVQQGLTHVKTPTMVPNQVQTLVPTQIPPPVQIPPTSSVKAQILPVPQPPNLGNAPGQF